jgi:Fe-S-cluster containining protein
MATSLPVINSSTATFECIYGRGCDGICCQNGRPPVYPEEDAVIAKNLPKLLPHLRPEARALVEKSGYLSNRRRGGQPMLRVVDGWCIFFHEGCVLHKVGAAEGDRHHYKPSACSLFPLAKTLQDEWYVRQWGVQTEQWNLFCLNPQASQRPAVDSLADEMALAARFDLESAARAPALSCTND